MSSFLIAAASLAATNSSTDQDPGSKDATAANSCSSSVAHSLHTPAIDNEQLTTSDISPSRYFDETLSENDRLLRIEIVRSRMGTFVLEIRTIIEHLRHVDWDVDTAVDSLGNAHHRARTYTRGHRPEKLKLADRIRNIPVEYFHTGEQERRQAVDILFLVVAQLNATREAGTVISLARSEAVFIMDIAAFDLEEALRILGDDKDRELLTQVLHMHFDNLRTRSRSEEERLEQDNAALAYYATLSDRADLHSLQKHLNSYRGDLVAAIADWQENGVDAVRHPQDRDQTRSESWIGRRHMIQEDGHELVLRPMPSSLDVHEYTARNLAW